MEVANVFETATDDPGSVESSPTSDSNGNVPSDGMLFHCRNQGREGGKEEEEEEEEIECTSNVCGNEAAIRQKCDKWRVNDVAQFNTFNSMDGFFFFFFFFLISSLLIFSSVSFSRFFSPFIIFFLFLGVGEMTTVGKYAAAGVSTQGHLASSGGSGANCHGIGRNLNRVGIKKWEPGIVK